jgi:hypothetical protein
MLGLEVPTTVMMKSSIFCYMALYSQVEPQDYTAPYSRRQYTRMNWFRIRANGGILL